MISAFTMVRKTPADLHRWMAGHHHIEPASGGAPMHVFARTSEGGPVYGPDAQLSESYDIQVPLKAVALQTHVALDFDSGSMSVELGYAMPFRPTVHLASAKGGFRDGITLGLGGNVQGQVSLSLSNDWPKMGFDGSVLGEKAVFDLKLVPIRF